MQEFLSKNSVRDFYEMSRREYSNKSNDKKSVLIMKYYNEMIKGKIYILSLLLFSILLSILIKFDPIFSAIVSLIIFLSVHLNLSGNDLILSGKAVCSESACSELLSKSQLMVFEIIYLIHCL